MSLIKAMTRFRRKSISISLIQSCKTKIIQKLSNNRLRNRVKFWNLKYESGVTALKRKYFYDSLNFWQNRLSAILQFFSRKTSHNREGVETFLSHRQGGDVSGSDALSCRRLWRNAPPFDFDDEGKEMTLGIRIVDKREGDSRSHNACRVGTKVHGTADVRSPPSPGDRGLFSSLPWSTERKHICRFSYRVSSMPRSRLEDSTPVAAALLWSILTSSSLKKSYVWTRIPSEIKRNKDGKPVIFDNNYEIALKSFM